MSTSSKRANRRKILAVGLGVLGVAGLSLASASQLNVNGTSASVAQAGTAAVTTAVCQTSTVAVSYGLASGTPGSLGTGAQFGFAAEADALTLTSFDAACGGKTVKVALGSASGTQIGATYSGTVPASGGAVTLTLNGGTPAFGSALTPAQINSISKVAVTVYGA
ncbi:MAG: hypothetical protein J7503_03880 [Cellulomonas iranensis]|uniref:hypothetical protein n=1 Tax=Cellulomonas iranensis TaxID=76862 RepID=UPI001B056CD1|nr:hypothetical protein [Cellulomonas iranensis]MBO9567944.1 hypothetical protein [Cellulomonas iranensis]